MFTILVALVRWSGLPWLIRNTWARRKVTIFLYHDPDPKDFRRQLRYLSRCYTFITLERLVGAIEAGEWTSIPPKSLVLTFDDGWRGNVRLVEICREFGVTPTIYLCSGLVGTKRHFWWTEANGEQERLKRLPSEAMQAELQTLSAFSFTREYGTRQALSKDEVEELKPFASFQSHSRLHRLLPVVSPAEQEQEIVCSKQEVADLVGACHHFSYPNGAYDDGVVALVKRAGYRSGRTIDLGWNDARTDPFRLKIAGAPERGSGNAAAASLFGLYCRQVWRGSLFGRYRLPRVRTPAGPAAGAASRRRSSPPRRVIVTDLETRTGLAVARSLAQAGYRVTGVATRRPAPGHWSRGCADRSRVPDPRRDAQSFVAGLASLASERAHDALLLSSDAALVAVSVWRELIEPRVTVALPPDPVVQRATDKEAIAAAAAAAGLDTPRTIRCSDPTDARAAAAEVGFPLIVKPPRSVTLYGSRLEQLPSRFATDLAALDDALVELHGAVLLQQALPGEVWSVGGVMADGRLIATAVSRYERTWPPRAGCACFSETVAPPGDLVERVRALMHELEWQGMFEVELLRGPDGSFSTIDVNPRAYGSLALAVAAGAPIPAIWCEWLWGGDPAPVVARPGIRYRFEDADLRYAASRLREGRAADAVHILRPRRRVVHAYFRLRDPGPAVGRIVEIAASRRPKLAWPKAAPTLRRHPSDAPARASSGPR